MQVVGNEDKGTTGNFEITINGILVHSKASGGKGRCQTEEERADVVKAVQAVI